MTVADKPIAWPSTLPHLVTEVPGPKALAQVAADHAAEGACAFDKGIRAAQYRTDRRRQAFGNAKRD